MYKHGSPTPEGMRKLDVTHRVALETLRMYPVIPALTRTVSNSFEFGGYRVPANSQILLGTTVGHHLPEYFPEPEYFDIERYTRDRAEHRQPGAFAPFGAGTGTAASAAACRNCRSRSPWQPSSTRPTWSWNARNARLRSSYHLRSIRINRCECGWCVARAVDALRVPVGGSGLANGRRTNG